MPCEDMRLFDGSLYESVRLVARGSAHDHENWNPPVLHRINPDGVQPTFASTSARSASEYGPEEFPTALSFLHLSADGEALWGAADPVSEEELPEGSEPGQVTVVRYAGGRSGARCSASRTAAGGDPLAG